MSATLKQPIKSMTAFGRRSLETDLGTFVFEMQSLNRRFLEVHLTVPRLFSAFEFKIRSWVREKVNRGAISLSVDFIPKEQSKIKVSANITLAKEIKNAWEQIAKALKLDFKENFHLNMLSEIPELLIYEQPQFNTATFESILKEGIFATINSLYEMKNREGKILKDDIENRIKSLRNLISQIEKEAGHTLLSYQEKLKQKLNLLLGQSIEQDDRILREIALLAEKADYTEEIVRFRSHLEQFILFLNVSLEQIGETRGKRLEFLLQELSRELNTISSKTFDTKVAHLVVEGKAEVEKIREQVQNIE